MHFLYYILYSQNTAADSKEPSFLKDVSCISINIETIDDSFLFSEPDVNTEDSKVYCTQFVTSLEAQDYQPYPPIKHYPLFGSKSHQNGVRGRAHYFLSSQQSALSVSWLLPDVNGIVCETI